MAKLRVSVWSLHLATPLAFRNGVKFLLDVVADPSYLYNIFHKHGHHLLHHYHTVEGVLSITKHVILLIL